MIIHILSGIVSCQHRFVYSKGGGCLCHFSVIVFDIHIGHITAGINSFGRLNVKSSIIFFYSKMPGVLYNHFRYGSIRIGLFCIFPCNQLSRCCSKSIYKIFQFYPVRRNIVNRFCNSK